MVRNNNGNVYAYVMAKHPTWEIEDVDLQMIFRGYENYYLYWLGLNPNFSKLPKEKIETLKQYVREHPNYWGFADGFTENEVYNFEDKDIEIIRKDPNSRMAHGAMRNKNYPFGEWEKKQVSWDNWSQLAKGVSRNRYYIGYESYSIIDIDRTIAEEFKNTNYAYIINKLYYNDVSNLPEDKKEFARANPNSAYSIGIGENISFRPDDNDLKFCLNASNANNQYAYLLGLKLNLEQLDKEVEIKKGEKITVREAVRTYLVDTKFAEGVAKNINFVRKTNKDTNQIESRVEEIKQDRKLIRNVAYILTPFASGYLQNPFCGEMEDQDIEVSMTYPNTPFAFQVAKKLNEQQLSDPNIEKFVIENINSDFTRGLFHNSDFNASINLKEHLFKKENRNKSYTRILSMLPAVQITKEDKKIVMDDPNSELAHGLGQNPSWGAVTNEEKNWIMDKNSANHNTMLARALALNTSRYKIGSGEKEIDFVINNPNSWFTNFIVEHEDFPINNKVLNCVRNNPSTKLALSIRYNPKLNIFCSYRSSH